MALFNANSKWTDFMNWTWTYVQSKGMDDAGTKCDIQLTGESFRARNVRQGLTILVNDQRLYYSEIRWVAMFALHELSQDMKDLILNCEILYEPILAAKTWLYSKGLTQTEEAELVSRFADGLPNWKRAVDEGRFVRVKDDERVITGEISRTR